MMSGIPPYETRQASLGLASKDEVKAAAAQSGAFFLDVRTSLTAKDLLEKMGCKQVLNAGGVSDLDYLAK